MGTNLPMTMLLAILMGAWTFAQAPPATGPATGPATAPAGPDKPSKDKAWVSGRVLGADGKPAVALEIRAEKDEPKGMTGGGGPRGPSEYKVLTDKEGHFLIKEMDVTDYILVAGNNDVGWIYQNIPVAAGKETKLGTLRLTKVD